MDVTVLLPKGVEELPPVDRDMVEVERDDGDVTDLELFDIGDREAPVERVALAVVPSDVAELLLPDTEELPLVVDDTGVSDVKLVWWLVRIRLE